jgi:hypothetical protein
MLESGWWGGGGWKGFRRIGKRGECAKTRVEKADLFRERRHNRNGGSNLFSIRLRGYRRFKGGGERVAGGRVAINWTGLKGFSNGGVR